MAVSRRVRLVTFTVLGLAVTGAGVWLVAQQSRVGAELISPGPLSAFHQEWNSEPGCWECHPDASFEVDDSLCRDCHEPLAQRMNAGRGFHAEVEVGCGDCHAEHVGVDAPLVRWPDPDQPFAVTQLGTPEAEAEKRDAFPHEEGTGYALAGAHAELACDACHQQSLVRDGLVLAPRLGDAREAKPGEVKAHPTYLGLGAGCADCHQDPHVPSQGTKCDDCHGLTAWSPVPDFDHDETRYPLVGRHADPQVTACDECHVTQATAQPSVELPLPSFEFVVAEERPPVFRGVGFGTVSGHEVRGETLPDCKACHDNPHRASEAFLDCDSCHTPRDWELDESLGFDHAATGFVLDGAHARTSCVDCHGTKEGGQEPLSLPARERCIDCHEDVHEGAFARELALAPEQGCARCHTTEEWEPAAYGAAEHADVLPLYGGHAIRCEDCHGTSSPPLPVEADCALVAAGKEVCTVPAPFPRLPSRGRAPVGPLEGGAQRCQACHVDVHEGRLSQDCASCHDIASWAEEARLDEAGHADLGFPIRGAHARIFDDCQKCHGGKAADGSLRKVALPQVRTDGCFVCHQEDDQHRGQLGRDCAACHGEDVWNPSTFSIADHQKTEFPLEAAHASVPCQECHVTQERYRWNDLACASCHQQDSPHGSQFRGQSCEACHSQLGWRPSSFGKAAHARTGFALQGPHDAECGKCHVPVGPSARYEGTPSQCAGCHEDPHLGQFAGRFGDGCSGCHQVEAWMPSTFDHDRARFALRGAHAQVECSTCHVEITRTWQGQTRKVVHYFPIAGRACDDCHQNPHAVQDE